MTHTERKRALVIIKSHESIPTSSCPNQTGPDLQPQVWQALPSVIPPATSSMDPELALLESCHENHMGPLSKTHAQLTAPIVTRDALDIYPHDNRVDPFPQRGLLGSVYSVNRQGLAQNSEDPRLYVNLNAPSSALICGVQVGVTKRSWRRGTNSMKGIRQKSHSILHSRDVPSERPENRGPSSPTIIFSVCIRSLSMVLLLKFVIASTGTKSIVTAHVRRLI